MRSKCSAETCPFLLRDQLRLRRLRLSDQGAGGGGLVLPGWRQGTDLLVVARQAVDTGLDQNHAELAVLVLAVALEVLADGDGLLILLGPYSCGWGL